MSEPDCISQTAEPMTADERRHWLSDRASEAMEKGASWHRFTVHPEIQHLTLYEGWKVRPEDQGEPRFQLARLPQEREDVPHG